MILLILLALCAILLLYIQKERRKAKEQQSGIWGFMYNPEQFVFTAGAPIPFSQIKGYKFSEDIPNQYDFMIEDEDISEPLPEYPFLRLYLENGEIKTLPLDKGGYCFDGRITVSFNDHEEAVSFSTNLNFSFFEHLPQNLKNKYRKRHAREQEKRIEEGLRRRKEMVERYSVSRTPSQKKDASVIGRAVAGGVIAGPVGSVVGALSAVDKNNKNRSK